MTQIRPDIPRSNSDNSGSLLFNKPNLHSAKDFGIIKEGDKVSYLLLRGSLGDHKYLAKDIRVIDNG